MFFEQSGVTVGSTPTFSPELVLGQMAGGAAQTKPGTLSFEVTNTGGVQFTSFVVQIKLHANGDWKDFIGGADWAATTVWSMIHASGNLAALAVAATGWAHVRVHGAYSVRFAAGTGGTPSTMRLRGGFNSGQ